MEQQGHPQWKWYGGTKGQINAEDGGTGELAAERNEMKSILEYIVLAGRGNQSESIIAWVEKEVSAL